MNFYSASVALLWATAFRVVTAPTASRHPISRGTKLWSDGGAMWRSKQRPNLPDKRP